MKADKIILALVGLLFTFSFAATAQNPFDNPSFEFTTFQPKDCHSVCKFPDNWEYNDCEPEGVLCEKAFATDGVVGVGVDTTGNAGCCTTYADMWQADVDLTGICEIAFDQIGPSFGQPENSKHVVFIDGTTLQVEDCGFVGNSNTQTCFVDVSGFTGMHEFRIRWEQRAGDHLGNSVLDNIRVTESSSESPVAAMASRDTICPGDTTDLTFQGGRLGQQGSWEWFRGSCGGANVGTGDTITVNPVADDTYYVRAEGGCDDTTACVSVSITVRSGTMMPDTVVAEPDTICRNQDTAVLEQFGGGLEEGGKYEWYVDSCGGVPIDTGRTTRVTPLFETTYYVRSVGPCDTSDCDSVDVSVNSRPNAYAGEFNSTCGGDTLTIGPDTINIVDDGPFLDTIPPAYGGLPPYTYSWEPDTNVVDSGFTFNPLVSTRESRDFIFTVTDSNGCIARDTTYVYIDEPFCDDHHIFIPNAFSPNGDGVNDELRVMGKGIDSFHMIIYNRWGEQIFRTRSKDNGWDGTYKGKVLDPGVFTYRITGYFYNGQQIREQGSITLLR